jgi:predicted HicB family RNase H-like nuclease
VGADHAASDRRASSRASTSPDEYLAGCEGDAPPPITERQFSGKFVVRTSPALHSRLTVEAAEQNVSMNQWVVQKLADRPPIGLFDL